MKAAEVFGGVVERSRHLPGLTPVGNAMRCSGSTENSFRPLPCPRSARVGLSGWVGTVGTVGWYGTLDGLWTSAGLSVCCARDVRFLSASLRRLSRRLPAYSVQS